MIPREHAATAAQGWWRDLQPDPATRRPGDRAALARLRRCAVVAEAMQDPATLALFRRLGATRSEDLPLVGLAAAVLAHARQDASGPHPGVTVARQVGPKSMEQPETALLKPLRFRRLIEADGLDERLTAFRRLVTQAGGSVPVRDVAAALLDWSEQRRTRWIYDYWSAAPPVPSATPVTTAKDTAA